MAKIKMRASENRENKYRKINIISVMARPKMAKAKMAAQRGNEEIENEGWRNGGVWQQS